MQSYHLNYIKKLEAEAIYIFREAVAQCTNSVLLFSGGKDSITLTKLAQKAFYPSPIPFPLLHIDTGHNFSETIKFRDNLVKELGVELIVRYVQDSIDRGTAVEEKTKIPSRNKLQSITLMEAFEEFNWDCAFGGARRDEEKARAKERIFSLRNDFGEWNPKKQRPELWNIFNCNKLEGESFRVFPISNWTEIDVWNYIKHENIKLPSLYFSHPRKVLVRNRQLLAKSEFIKTDKDDIVTTKNVRYRTLGDMTCTAAIESKATLIDEVINEIKNSKTTERGGRLDDTFSETAMEDRKKQGYF